MSTKADPIGSQIEAYDLFRAANPQLRLPEATAENRVVLEILHAARSLDPLIDADKDLKNMVVFRLPRSIELLDKFNLVGTTFFRLSLNLLNASEQDLTKVKFIECHLNNSNFRGADLTDAVFFHGTFKNIKLRNSKIENTHFERPIFNGYNSINDDTDQAIIGLKSWFFDWSKLRILTTIPLFSISWATLLGTLALLNTIGWANANRDKLSAVIAPIEMPPTLIWLLIATFFLAIAATIYAVACPVRIKEITETEWTEKNLRPRIEYFEKRFAQKKRAKAAIFAIYIFGFIGMAITVTLVLDRAWSVYCFSMNASQPAQCENE